MDLRDYFDLMSLIKEPTDSGQEMDMIWGLEKEVTKRGAEEEGSSTDTHYNHFQDGEAGTKQRKKKVKVSKFHKRNTNSTEFGGDFFVQKRKHENPRFYKPMIHGEPFFNFDTNTLFFFFFSKEIF